MQFYLIFITEDKKNKHCCVIYLYILNACSLVHLITLGVELQCNTFSYWTSTNKYNMDLTSSGESSNSPARRCTTANAEENQSHTHTFAQDSPRTLFGTQQNCSTPSKNKWEQRSEREILRNSGTEVKRSLESAQLDVSTVGGQICQATQCCRHCEAGASNKVILESVFSQLSVEWDDAFVEY